MRPVAVARPRPGRERRHGPVAGGAGQARRRRTGNWKRLRYLLVVMTLGLLAEERAAAAIRAELAALYGATLP